MIIEYVVFHDAMGRLDLMSLASFNQQNAQVPPEPFCRAERCACGDVLEGVH